MRITKTKKIVKGLKTSKICTNHLFKFYNFKDNTCAVNLIDSCEIEKLTEKDETLSASKASQILKIAEECDFVDVCDEGNGANFVATTEGIFLENDMALIKENIDEYKEFVKSLYQEMVTMLEVEL